MSTEDYAIKKLSSSIAFSCDILRFEHTSPTLGGLRAVFAVILPQSQVPVPALYWLSGLTCTDQNFITKAGGAQYASLYNVAIVCPDTSPRGAGAPGEDISWSFGTGAGFYVDATTPGFCTHYRMHSYIVRELPHVLQAALPGRINPARRAVTGHSMGGMGALSLALRNEGCFVSVSALAPICNPVHCGWGKRCFTGYLGDDREVWKAYDPTHLMKSRKKPLCDQEILIDQGTVDEFLHEYLMPYTFVEACQQVGQQVSLLDLNSSLSLLNVA